MVRVLLLALLVRPGPASVRPGRRASQEAEVAPCVVANLAEAADAQSSLDFVRRLFLLRDRFWPSGEAAHPVNLPASSELRERFTREVFGQSVKDQAAYWNERYFHGTRPPPTVASEAAVLLFVARTPGAVGYVGRDAVEALPTGVRRLMCLDEAEGTR